MKQLLTKPRTLLSTLVLAGLSFCPPTMVYSEPEHELPPLDTLGMPLSPAQIEAITTAMQAGREISKVAERKNGRPFRRDAHAKATGCVRATFSVNPDIPARFQHSVLQQPGQEYQAWIRFSNGDMLVQPDQEPDARGMAIKLMGVEGERIAPELTGAKTQDFIMTNTPAFFNRNVFDYAENIQYLTKLDRTGWFFGLVPPRFHPKEFIRAVQTVSSKIDTPFAAQYYSMLPYQLGTEVVKFSARACPGSHYPAVTDKSNPDYLTDQMATTLQDGSACFDFMLQPKIPGADMPIDDATVIWSEDVSAFIPVARVHIPPQQFTGEAQQQFCENLSMNPWHGVGEWQPLSSLNQARRVVYNAVSQFRHQQNQASRHEPDSWCIANADEPCSPTQGLIVKKSRWPLPRCFDSLYTPLNGSTVDSQCRAGMTAN